MMLRELGGIRSPYLDEIRGEERAYNALQVLLFRFGEEGAPSYRQMDEFQKLHPTLDLHYIALRINSLEGFLKLMAEFNVEGADIKLIRLIDCEETPEDEGLKNILEVLKYRFGVQKRPSIQLLEEYRKSHPNSDLVAVALRIGSVQKFIEHLKQS